MEYNAEILDRITDKVLTYHPGARERQVRATKRTVSAIEVCVGAGGAALGLEQAGFKHAALVDNDPHACATLRINRPYWNVLEADMCRFNATYWRGVDLLTGGLPCPPFSIAGKQLGANDDRDMFPHMLRIVKEAHPRAVLIENVRGIMAGRFDGFRSRIERILSTMGFSTSWKVYNAVDFGVPQIRFRAFLLALRRGATSAMRWPQPVKETPLTVGDAIGTLMAERGWRGAPAWQKKAAAPAPTIVGGSHKHGGPDLGPTRARREWAILGVDGLGIANEPPSPSFSGMPRLTLPMVARLQTFPNDWRFSGTKTTAYRQVGNALPVRLAYTVAKAVKECLA